MEATLALINAVEEGDVACVQSFLECGCDVNTLRPETRDSLLLIAAERGHTEVVRLLLEHGADPNLVNMCGETPVHAAAKIDSIDVITFLCKHGADVNICDVTGSTALYCTVRRSYFRSIRLLLRSGADPNISESAFQQSPLHEAVRRGDFRLAQILLENGADVNARDSSGATPLHEASANDDLHMCRLLLKHGADVTVEENIGQLTPAQTVKICNRFFHEEDSNSKVVVFSGEVSRHPTVVHSLRQPSHRQQTIDRQRRSQSARKRRALVAGGSAKLGRKLGEFVQSSCNQAK